MLFLYINVIQLLHKVILFIYFLFVMFLCTDAAAVETKDVPLAETVRPHQTSPKRRRKIKKRSLFRLEMSITITRKRRTLRMPKHLISKLGVVITPNVSHR